MMLLATYLFLLLFCSIVTVVGVVTLRRLFAKARPTLPSHDLPPITVLKPLKGVDDALESNLETLFRQAYPTYTLLFGIEGKGDPAEPLVRRLMARYPEVSSRLVVHNGGRGFNPKVSNLRAMLEVDTHDILVINDSNIAVPPDYLERMVEHLQQPDVGLVTSLFVGNDEKNLPALLENMHLNGPVLNSLALYRAVMQEALVVGKSLMFRRSVLDDLGGFESLAYVQAEDYFMGKMMKRGGFHIVFCSQPVTNVNHHNTMAGFLSRTLRWAIARSHMVPQLYPFELLINPMFLAALAPLFGVSLWLSIPWMLALLLLRDGLQWHLVRGRQRLPQVLLLTPLRELLLLLVWFYAPFANVISWRGHQFHVGEGAHLFRKPRKDTP